MKTPPAARLRHAPADWKPGRTRVRDEDGLTGTFVGNSEPAPGTRGRGWLGVLVRFDNDPDTPLDVDPADLAVLDGHPFTGIAPHVPTRYAPGHSYDAPYPYTGQDRWFPVIYNPAHADADEKIWLVEPFPAAFADGTDGYGDISEEGGRGVAVLCGSAAPVPRGSDPDGDWIISFNAPSSECAYDVFVTTNKQLMAAWCEAYAIATALNNKTAAKLSVRPEDIEVLLAAERGDLVGDSRFAGKRGELRWKPINTTGQRVEPTWLGARQARRLRGDQRFAMIQPYVTTEGIPSREGSLSTAGRRWTNTVYGLTVHGRQYLAEIRAQYDGPTRCRVCGCTDDHGCPPADPAGQPCRWIEANLCSACSAWRGR